MRGNQVHESPKREFHRLQVLVDIRMIEEGDALVEGRGDDVGGSGPFGATEWGTIPAPAEFEIPIADA